MRNLILLVALVAFLGVLPGCLVQDRDHNRQHYKYVRRDLRSMHRDIDHFFLWNESSPLVNREEPYD